MQTMASNVQLELEPVHLTADHLLEIMEPPAVSLLKSYQSFLLLMVEEQQQPDEVLLTALQTVPLYPH